MGLLGAVSVKPLLITLAVVGAALVASNAGWYARASQLSAQRDAAGARVTAVETERDAWKGKAAELKSANAAAQDGINSLTGELARVQGEQRRVQREGEQAVAAAKADAAEADRTLKNFIARYAQQIRNPDCAGAMAVVQQACPALEGY